MNFLQTFFSEINTQNIKYIVLRNYESLPVSTAGSDLDIFVNSNQVDQFLNVLNRVSRLYGGSVVSKTMSDIYQKYCIMGNTDGGWGLMVDLFIERINYKGNTILSNKLLWDNTSNYNSICILNKQTDAFIGLIKELLNNRTCKEKYLESFRKYCFDIGYLKSIFSKTDKEFLAEVIYRILKNEGSNTKAIRKLSEVLNNAFPKKLSYFTSYFLKLKRILKQPGYVIVFVGTDGSGKSTLINQIISVLNEAFHNAVYYEHLRPNKIPSLARLFGEKDIDEEIVTNPHKREPSGFLGSIFRYSYYMIDYTIGYFLKIFPKKAFKSSVWIFDRYYYDYIIDPKRLLIKLPRWILKTGELILPKPDIILCLGTLPETIHSRKPELPLDEVARQVKELKYFSQHHKRAVWIDTGKTEAESVDKALKAILNLMSKRFESV